MEIRNLMNINVLSANIAQVKYFYIHCWETPQNSVTSYSTQLSCKCTANKLTELSKLVDFKCDAVTLDENFKPRCRDRSHFILYIYLLGDQTKWDSKKV